MKGKTEDGLIDYHFGLGQYIRNNFGLWAGNKALINDSGASHQDSVSSLIIRALWLRLRGADK